MGAIAVPGAAAGGDHPVDQPARRILPGDRAGGCIRRGRTGATGADGRPRRSRAGMAAGGKGFSLCRGGCLAASLINPYTYRLHVHLFEYLRDSYASQHIIEFFSLSFHHPAAIFFESMLLLAAVSVFWYARRGRYTESL